jgi:DNA-binding winged helix-turn-helix (wHTH) protein/Flp pilus assembly protein TadD
MGAIGHDGLAVPGKVELAHEPPFRLGVLDVEPATRQLKSAICSETIEPRVMQVLVALYRADTIVTRDELTERCWGGRVVGDDAINRVLSRIRHIAGDIGEGSFSVETITKVGYRLVADGRLQPDAAAEVAPAPVRFALDRRDIVLGLGAAAALAALAGTVWVTSGSTNGQSPEARLLYDKAIALRESTSRADDRQAIAYLREAVRIAPDYGEAWGALAFEYRNALLGHPAEEVAGFEERLLEAIRQANRYDPGNADAAFARRVQRLHFGRWDTMEPVYRDLAGRFPSHSTGHSLLGSLLMDVGRWSDAVEALQTAKKLRALAPLPRYKLTVSLWSAGRISEAEQEIDEALRWSAHGAIWQTKIKLLAMTGKPQAALTIVNDASAKPGAETEEDLARWRLFLSAMISRAPADVERAVADLVEFARQDTGTPVPQAFECAMLGARDTAFAILEGCYLGIGDWAAKRPADPSGNASHPLFQPQARSLWGDPRFARILDGIGLEQYWRETGTLPDYRRA